MNIILHKSEIKLSIQIQLLYMYQQCSYKKMTYGKSCKHFNCLIYLHSASNYDPINTQNIGAQRKCADQ